MAASEPRTFAHFGLSERTMEGLRRGRYNVPTEIQKAAIPLALQGKDILGAAKTGSGKTLAFLIPVLERLQKEKWQGLMGCGAIVISPTRELAQQIFKVLSVVGDPHSFSAGLLSGGHDIQEEAKRLHKMAIVVGTPGRILHHLDETTHWDTGELRMLVIDEADRLMDMGFEKTVSGILDHLPQSRQTMLFSATQTKDLKVLSRLNVKDPEYISVHAESTSSTPKRLSQNYTVCKLEDKMDCLYSFIRSHMQEKTLVFFSTCSMARFVYSCFSKLLRKAPVACAVLNSRMKQARRTEVFHAFCARPRACVLFCTDVAARGLDFPVVDWVVQMDCPSHVDEYIHRVGRTARIGAAGKALTVFTPSEEMMIPLLQRKKIPLREVEVNPGKWISMRCQLVALLVQFQPLKHLAQKAFVAYFRSVYFQSNKLVFDMDKLPAEQFALSLGLSKPPALTIKASNALKNVPWDLLNSMKTKKKPKAPTKMERKFQANALFTEMEHRNLLIDDAEDGGDDEPFLKPKAAQPDVQALTAEEKALNMSNKKRMKLQKQRAKWDGARQTFEDSDASGDDGEQPVQPVLRKKQGAEEAVLQKDTELSLEREHELKHVTQLKSTMQEADVADKEMMRKRVKNLHLLRKIKRREAEGTQRPDRGDGDEAEVVLGSGSESGDYEEAAEEEDVVESDGADGEGSEGGMEEDDDAPPPLSPPPKAKKGAKPPAKKKARKAPEAAGLSPVPKKKARKAPEAPDFAAQLQQQEAMALALLQR